MHKALVFNVAVLYQKSPPTAMAGRTKSQCGGIVKAQPNIDNLRDTDLL